MNELSKARVTISLDRGVWVDGKVAAHRAEKSFSSFVEDLLRSPKDSQLDRIEFKLDEVLGGGSSAEYWAVSKMKNSVGAPAVESTIAREQRVSLEGISSSVPGQAEYRSVGGAPAPEVPCEISEEPDDDIAMLAKKQAELDAEKAKRNIKEEKIKKVRESGYFNPQSKDAQLGRKKVKIGRG